MWDQCIQQTSRGPGDVLNQRQYQQQSARPTTTAGGPPAGEAERVLRWVEQNLTALTRAVPMAEIEDLPPSMQPHVVGVPRPGSNSSGIWKTSLFTMAGPTGPVLS
jgi:hypothetical protein